MTIQYTALGFEPTTFRALNKWDNVILWRFKSLGWTCTKNFTQCQQKWNQQKLNRIKLLRGRILQNGNSCCHGRARHLASLRWRGNSKECFCQKSKTFRPKAYFSKSNPAYILFASKNIQVILSNSIAIWH